MTIKRRESTRHKLMQPLPPRQSPLDWRNWPPRYIISVIAASLLLPLTLASCSGDSRIPTYPVSGKVTVNGEPAVGAQVVLYAKGHSLPQNVGLVGSVRQDGTFEIGTYDANDGAPAGEYVVTVEWRKIVESEGGAGRGPNVLPAVYAKPESSPLKITVTDQVNDLPIDIKK